MSNDELFLLEWQLIAGEFNLKIEAPYYLCIGGANIEVNLMLYNFGGFPGMVIVNDYSKIEKYRKKMGRIGFSVLDSPKAIAPLTDEDKKDIINMLSDWGWTGSEKEKPDWIIENINEETNETD